MTRDAALATFLLCVVVALPSCGVQEVPRPSAVVVGIDGADWRLIDPLIEQGRMPNLARLRAAGVSGPIATLEDIQLSPAIWTSVATGKTPTKHGITWFLVDLPDGSRAPVRSSNRRVKALWNILAENGRRPASVGWWATYPAEDVGGGIVVSDALGAHGFGRMAVGVDSERGVHPAEAFTKLEALMPRPEAIGLDFVRRFFDMPVSSFEGARLGATPNEQPDPRNVLHLFQQYAATAQGYTAIAERLIENANPDLLLVYYEQVDSLSHLFMKHAEPKLPWIGDDEHERYRSVVDEWYAYQDELLGRLLAKIDLERTAVVVLSDHGFKSGARRPRSEATVSLGSAHLDHEADGIFVAAGPGIRRAAALERASVLDVAPTLLHYLGLPVAQDMDGEVLADVFDSGWHASRPVARIATFEGAETDPPQLLARGHDAGAEQLAANLTALEVLGYVEGGPSDLDATATSPEIHVNLGRLHARNGELALADAELRLALQLSPESADILVHLGEVARLRGDTVRAAELARRALRLDPTSTAVLAALARVEGDAGDLEASIELFRRALLRDRTIPALWVGLGDALHRVGRHHDAETAFVRALELDPDDFAIHYDLGVTTAELGRTAEARHHFESALEIDAGHELAAQAWNNLGTLALEMGEPARASRAFERAVAADPDHFAAHYNLGVQFESAGNPARAIAHYERAVALRPGHAPACARLARAHLRAGRIDASVAPLRALRAADRTNWFGALGLAIVVAHEGRALDASGYLDEALALGGRAAADEAATHGILPEDSRVAVAP